MFWLIRGAFHTGKDDYAIIVKDLLGHKAGVFLHIIFILLTFCVGTLYFIVSSSFMPQILEGFGMGHDMATDDNTRMLVIASIFCIMLPLGL